MNRLRSLRLLSTPYLTPRTCRLLKHGVRFGMTWWGDSARVYFALSRIGFPSIDAKRCAYALVTGFNFRLTKNDAVNHGGEIEEQLWAMRQGL